MDAIAKASRPGERGGRIKAAFATFAILLALSLLGNVGCSPSSAGVSGSDGVAEEDSTDYLLKFVDEYNAIAETKIEPGERFSPHDKESQRRAFDEHRWRQHTGIKGDARPKW